MPKRKIIRSVDDVQLANLQQLGDAVAISYSCDEDSPTSGHTGPVTAAIVGAGVLCVLFFGPCLTPTRPASRKWSKADASIKLTPRYATPDNISLLPGPFRGHYPVEAYDTEPLFGRGRKRPGLVRHNHTPPRFARLR